MMREWLLALSICVTVGCSSESNEENANPALQPIAFDGGVAAEAAAEVAHGKRIADVLGCTGCHGEGLQGQRFYELYASNLTRDLASYSDHEVERVLREGVTPAGRDLWGMPSEIFQHLSKPDMEALISYMRTLQPAGRHTEPPLPFPPEVHEMIERGEFKPAAATVRDTKTAAPADLGTGHELGRYIARVTCAECHGPQLDGREGGPPDLTVASAYSHEEFEILMREGIGIEGRKLDPMMEGVSKGRFAKMTPNEIQALHGYLKARAEKPQ